MSKFSFSDYSFILKDADEAEKYTLSEAKLLCESLGNGWRVPTLKELELVRSECLVDRISKLTSKLKFETKETYYLTDTIDEYDGWPLSFSFDDGISYISSEECKGSLRLVRSEVSSESVNKLSKEDFILKTISVIKKYVPGLSQTKFVSFLNESLEYNSIEFSEMRYVTLEDYNMCSYPDDFYLAHFHPDNDLVTLWERDFFACGYKLHELDDEEEGIRETYIAFIDLLDEKYIRVNGYGDEIEYGSENPTDEHPDWKGWFNNCMELRQILDNSTNKRGNSEVDQTILSNSDDRKVVEEKIKVKKTPTVVIGSQEWMINNLDVDTFRNGDTIPEAKTNKEWIQAGENKQPAWCYYNNDPANGIKYGKLYNWYAVNDSRGLAPDGCHIASDVEWSQLIEYLGGDKVAGKKMKSTAGWPENGNGTNESSFTGFPAGYRSSFGGFYSIGYGCIWWSSSEYDTTGAWSRNLNCGNGIVLRLKDSETSGFSVRCLRD